jgi:hypothetical protein
MSVSGALMNPFIGQYAGKRGVRGILLVCGIWTGCCMFLLSMVSNLWMLYLTGFAMGALSSTCVALCANVIVQQSYFGAQASGILGGVMAGSGVGGMIFSIVIPQCMARFGWQTGLRVMGISWLVLLWMAAILLGKQTMVHAGGNGAVGLGMTRAEALKSPKLYLQMLVIIIICACCGIQQQLPSLLRAYGLAEGTVSVMIVVMTAFLAIGKVAQGILYGKLGIRKGGCLMMVVFAAGFLAMAFFAMIGSFAGMTNNIRYGVNVAVALLTFMMSSVGWLCNAAIGLTYLFAKPKLATLKTLACALALGFGFLTMIILVITYAVQHYGGIGWQIFGFLLSSIPLYLGTILYTPYKK